LLTRALPLTVLGDPESLESLMRLVLQGDSLWLCEVYGAAPRFFFSSPLVFAAVRGLWGGASFFLLFSSRFRFFSAVWSLLVASLLLSSSLCSHFPCHQRNVQQHIEKQNGSLSFRVYAQTRAALSSTQDFFSIYTSVLSPLQEFFWQKYYFLFHIQCLSSKLFFSIDTNTNHFSRNVLSPIQHFLDHSSFSQCIFSYSALFLSIDTNANHFFFALRCLQLNTMRCLPFNAFSFP
jgi:hypothetical protein